MAQNVTADQERRTPAHARPGIRHWAVVAAGCAAVVGGALAATSATGATTPTHAGAAPTAGPSAGPSAPSGPAVPSGPSGIDPAKAELPLDCGPFPVAVSLKVSAPGRPVAVVAAHCQADGGTPPDAVFAIGAGPDGKPKVLATLAEDRENLTFTELTLRSDDSIRGRAKGYSSDDVPRFAPDLTVEVTWTRQGSGWKRTETRTPAKQA